MTRLFLTLLAALLVLGGLAACAPLKAINAITTSATYTKKADVPFGDDPRQKLDVYIPRDLQGPAPIVVFFYGGSWNQGDRHDYAFVGEALAARGIIAVVADYRVYPQVRYPAFVEDGASAVAWTVRQAKNIGGDPKHVFVMGHSAGAYNAAMVALDKRWLNKMSLSPGVLRGWIGLAGPYDFLPIENPDVKPVFLHPNSPPDSQPINHVTAGAPPALLLASNKDDLVDPKRNTGGLAKKLRDVGVPVRELYFNNTSHATIVVSMAWPFRQLAPVLHEVEQFVKTDGGRQTIPLKK
ncbi:alpha/beta hydrolase [uncultured Oxalicibacterium sp.]|uniref:alpha/beta hydrolase n=1 Tax=uncultured Oxalicibacterium sp. TaxID=1168540 RepID=UPI0025E4D959|nr:alpha/beta hydrolase [uncultured Oxalicibacterium sp.]